MNSKECLDAILDILNYEQVDECDKKGLLRTIKQDLDRLEKGNQELKRCQDTIRRWMDNHKKLIIDNGKMKKALSILAPLVSVMNLIDGYVVNTHGFEVLTEHDYEILKEVLQDE